MTPEQDEPKPQGDDPSAEPEPGSDLEERKRLLRNREQKVRDQEKRLAAREERLREREQRQEFAGIPDSRPFIAPIEQPNAMTRLEACHINGRLVKDMQLEPQVLAALDYGATDEGIAEKNARPNVREPSGVSLGSDEWNKALKQRTDDVKERDMPMFEARDPLREVADQYAKPGMRPRFLSQKKVKDGGHQQYVPVKRENGDPVMVRGMLLGHIPEDVARERNKHYQKRGNELLNELNKEYKKEGGATALSDQ